MFISKEGGLVTYKCEKGLAMARALPHVVENFGNWGLEKGLAMARALPHVVENFGNWGLEKGLAMARALLILLKILVIGV